MSSSHHGRSRHRALGAQGAVSGEGRRPSSQDGLRERLIRLGQGLGTGDEPTLGGSEDLARSPGTAEADPTGTFPVPGWDRYVPEAFLGEGGMGRVYKAFDPLLGRHVALKFLRSGESGLLETFLHEARAQARLDHPHICKVYEVGDVQGHPFIAMQLVEGCTLKALGAEVPLEQRVALLVDVAEAVHAAHRMGILHRDLKPANIRVEYREDQGWRPYVLDFGLARELSEAGLTSPTRLQGTPAYMSPEQARGEALDRRSDVYGLGATFYECLGGCPPFPSEGMQDLLDRIASEVPPPLRTRVPNLPEDLEAVVARCLEKDPKDRYPSALALAEDLLRFLDGHPVSALAHSPWRRGLKWVRRNRLAAAGLGFAVFCATGFALAGGWMVVRARAQAQLAAEYQVDVDHMTTMLRGAALMPRHSLRPHHAQILDRLAEVSARMGRQGELAQGPGSYALGRGHLLLGDPHTAKVHLERAWNLGLRSPLVAAALGECHGRLFQLKLAELGTLQNATRLMGPVNLQEIPPTDRERLNREYRDPALRFMKLGAEALSPGQGRLLEGRMALFENRFDQAIADTTAVLQVAPWSHEAWLLKAEGHHARAAALGGHDPAEAERELDRMAEALDQAGELARSAPEVFEARAQLCITRLSLRILRRTVAKADMQAVLDATERILEVDPGSWTAPTLQAIGLLRWAEYQQLVGEDPRPATDRAIAAAQRAHDLKPDFVWSLNALAFALHNRAEWGRRLYGEDGSDAIRRALGAYERLRGMAFLQDQVALNMGNCYRVLGMTALAQGRDGRAHLAQAVAHFEESLTLRPTFGAAFELATPLKWLGILERWQGGDALPWADRALEAYQRALAHYPDHSGTLGRMADIHLLRADTLYLSGGDPEPDLQAALGFARRSRETGPRSYLGYVNLGEALVQLARWRTEHGQGAEDLIREAALATEEALRWRNGDPELRLARALVDRERVRLALRQGHAVAPDLNRGLALVEATIRQRRGFYQAWILKGELLSLAARSRVEGASRQGWQRRAEEAWREAVRLNGNLAREVLHLQGMSRR